MYLRLFYIVFIAAFISAPHVSAEDLDCEQLKSVRDVLACALKQHPDVRLAKASLVQGQHLEEVAAQRPNPELNSQVDFGNTELGDNFSHFDISLAHTFELGGKRGSRIALAQAELDQRQASSLGAREQVFIGTLGSLYRIRQIQSELEVLRGALESFSKIQKQYRSRPRLNPEQQASLRIFEVAEGDYKLRLAPLETDLDRELRALELALGRPFSPRPELLPERKKVWPRLDEPKAAQPILGSQVQTSLAGLQVAQAQLGLEQSKAWPDLKVAPTYETQNQSFAGFNAIGLNFSFPLPVFHLNGGGRAFALQGVGRAQIAVEATQKEAQDQREYFLKRYQKAVHALQSSITPRELDKKHHEVEALFDRGLLPGTLVIEIHRQMLDFTKSQNEQELAAIESLSRFYAFQGRLFEEQLQ